MSKQMIIIPYADYEDLVQFASNMHGDRYNIDPFYRPKAKELHDRHYPSTFGGEGSPYQVVTVETTYKFSMKYPKPMDEVYRRMRSTKYE